MGTPTPPEYLQYDNLDDRREVHQLLARLAPRDRIQFLAWCCQQATVQGSSTKPVVAADTIALAEQARWDSAADERLTLEVWLDVWRLTTGQYRHLNLSLMLARLVEMARRPSRQPGCSPILFSPACT